MTIGPIQLLAITFHDFEPKGDILAELLKLNKSGTIRLIDLQFVQKNEAGNISMMELSGVSEAEQGAYGSVISSLMGADIDSEPEDFTELLMVVEESYGLTLKDFLAVADKIRPGAAAALLLIEHAWATPFSELVTEAGGQMTAQGFLTRHTMNLVGKELEAQVNAVQAIEVSEAVQVEAARRAAYAIALSESIQEEAAARAIDALVLANIIEESAVEHAVTVVTEAQLVEAEAIAEARQVVAAAEEIKENAAVEAVSALIASEIIQQEAAVRAVDALVASAVIQEGARQRALAAVSETDG